MALRSADGRIVLSGVITVEEAEALCQLLLAHPAATIDLTDCLHLHAAVVQVLLAARRSVASPPKDAFLAGVVLSSLLRGLTPNQSKET